MNRPGDWTAFPSDRSNDTPGMSYREWLAGVALQGILANPREDFARLTSVGAAGMAVEYADALVAELAKKREG